MERCVCVFPLHLHPSTTHIHGCLHHTPVHPETAHLEEYSLWSCVGRTWGVDHEVNPHTSSLTSLVQALTAESREGQGEDVGACEPYLPVAVLKSDFVNICFTYSKTQLQGKKKEKKQSLKIENKLKRMKLTTYQVGGETALKSNYFKHVRIVLRQHTLCAQTSREGCFSV